jgi:hypothetical protein
MLLCLWLQLVLWRVEGRFGDRLKMVLPREIQKLVVTLVLAGILS